MDGSTILAGEAITWTFTVTNTGNITLTAINLSDDVLGPVSCPKPDLAAGETMVCEVSSTAAPGPHDNLASIAHVYTDDHGNM